MINNYDNTVQKKPRHISIEKSFQNDPINKKFDKVKSRNGKFESIYGNVYGDPRATVRVGEVNNNFLPSSKSKTVLNSQAITGKTSNV